MVQVQVQPRIQKDRWSLYWKESMSTKTKLLDSVSMDLALDATVAELCAAVARKLDWEGVETLYRLEGFTEPWEKVVYKGRDLSLDSTLEAAGVAGEDVTVTVVRRVLIAEGWKIIKGDDEDSDSSTDEEEDF